MSKKKVWLAAAAAFALALSVSVLLLTTYALFSDSAETHNRLQAGTLDIGLFETRMTGNALNAEGRFEDYSEPIDGGRRDLETYDGNVFEIQNACPGIWREGAFAVVNNDSSTAFTYSVTIVGVEAGAEDAAASQALLSEIMITVTDCEEKETSFSLSEAAGDEGKTVALGEMLSTDTEETFTIRAEFIDSGTAQSGSVTFDIRVTAVQATE